ncbi:Mobile element protein [Fimbriiglobus ruber]|uniref:Mobile element protein n=1 Tax=Fimbriiglobus ruber TaxID=1908690 RepID=A0A225DKJ3_9BACT|nr:Mobile element protein [Fimbriiglobus ruber]
MWCVHFRGSMHQLGPHPEGFPAPRQVKGKWNAPAPILQAFHALLATPSTAKPPKVPDPPPVAGLTVPDVFDLFLEWCQKNRSARTYEWSQNHIQNFLDSLTIKRLPVDDLKPFHVQQWVDSKDTWGANHTRGAITAVQRAFTWAEKVGHITKSPIRHVEKPAPKRREQMLTPAEFQTLLSHVKDEPFRDVLEFCWETGARVQEVRLIEGTHFKSDRGRVEIPPDQAKGKKRWRIIYLTDRADEIVRRLAPIHTEGPIFRNVDGNQWDAQNFNCRFFRLHKKLGVKYALTAIRHSFATRMLEAGVDHLTVSALLGHADGAMLAKVYSHVGENTNYLRDELRKASRGDN